LAPLQCNAIITAFTEAITALQPDNHAGCTLLLQLPPVDHHYYWCIAEASSFLHRDSVPPDNHAVCILLLQLPPVYCCLSLLSLLSLMASMSMWCVCRHYYCLLRSFHNKMKCYLVPGVPGTVRVPRTISTILVKYKEVLILFICNGCVRAISRDKIT